MNHIGPQFRQNFFKNRPHAGLVIGLFNPGMRQQILVQTYNWNTLNRMLINNIYSAYLEKVLKKLGVNLNKKEIEGIISCQQGVIENVLKRVYEKVNTF